MQRLSVDDSGAVSVGLRVIPGLPQPVAVRLSGAVTPDGKKYDRALLMAEDAARKIAASLILAPAAYQPNRPVDIYIDAAKRDVFGVDGRLSGNAAPARVWDCRGY